MTHGSLAIIIKFNIYYNKIPWFVWLDHFIFSHGLRYHGTQVAFPFFFDGIGDCTKGALLTSGTDI